MRRVVKIFYSMVLSCVCIKKENQGEYQYEFSIIQENRCEYYRTGTFYRSRNIYKSRRGRIREVGKRE